jgi:hypothetical protein
MLWEKHCAKRSVIRLTADTLHAKGAALKASLEAAGVKFTNAKRPGMRLKALKWCHGVGTTDGGG